MESDLLRACRPSDDVAPGLARRVRARWAENRAEAAAYRRWTAGLAAFAIALGAAAALAPADALADPFEGVAAEAIDDVLPPEAVP